MSQRHCHDLNCAPSARYRTSIVKPIKVAKWALVVLTFVPVLVMGMGIYTVAPYSYYPRYVINETGDWGLRFLVFTLCVTPVRRLTGWHSVIQVRRALGLAAFAYSALHVILWAALDWYFEIGPMLRSIVASAFLWIGTIAFIMMIPLAVTSNRFFMSRLGRRWRQLHWLTYAATVPTLAHFWLRGSFGAVNVRKWVVIVMMLMLFRMIDRLRSPRASARPQVGVGLPYRRP